MPEEDQFTLIPRRRTLRPEVCRLPDSVSIVGLGCSSFSTFFWTSEEQKAEDCSLWSPETIPKSHPRVKEWIETVHYAVSTAGITLLDTAPWYGHGTSEIVIGWALEALDREKLQINTKIGRYEADPSRQFDYSKETTFKSVQRSIKRMNCGYIDVLQLHDPEFAPSLDQLMTETIPAMISCREQGLCRALGMTGYPLEVQHLILERSMEVFGENVWDQALTYSHFNLHDCSLVSKPLDNGASYLEFCRESLNMQVLAAAPLSMGLLTASGPPEWHPASPELKQACREASEICEQHGVDISTLALLFALSHPDIPCTILGMRNTDEVKRVHVIATRIREAGGKEMTQSEVLASALTERERETLDLLQDRVQGPFARVIKTGEYEWDGVAAARDFWREAGKEQTIQSWLR